MLEEDTPKLADRLRDARRDAGFVNRESVVEILGAGFSAGSLHRWENGEVAAPFDKVVQLAELYGVSLDWLAGRTTCRNVHELDHGKLIVDQDAMRRLQELRNDEPIPDDLLGPRFSCVWTLPLRFTSLGAAAAEPVNVNLTNLIKVRRNWKGKT